MLLDDLNEPQRAAVTTINGALQIIAGAGSGKTRVLTYRIAYLIEQGVNPWNIVALTFTNKAAREIQNRIAKIAESPHSSFQADTKSNTTWSAGASANIWAGTFHSVFARILRTEAHQIGYNRNFTIYDVEDATRALKRAKTEFNINTDIKDSAIYSAISSAKNKMLLPEKYADNASSRFERIVAECYDAYQKTLLKSNAMDFDDILLNMLKVLYIPETLAKYQDKFHYILIDEYQDTNKVQHIIVNQLAKHRQNICVVGDDAQSIYKWRGAEISNIINFVNDFPNCKTIKLEQNYRSTKNILAAADSLIRHNKNQLKKHLWTDNEAGEKIKFSEYQNDREEAETIVNCVKQHVKSGKSIQDFAVLYRTNAQSRVFEDACRAANLPYILVGGMSFYKRKEVKDTLAYLQLLVNPNDNLAATRIINEPPRGIGKTTIATLEEIATKNNVSFLKALTLITPDTVRQKKSFGNILQFNDLIKHHAELNNQNQAPEHLVEYIEGTGMLDYYREIDDDEARDRIANIEQIISAVIEFISEKEGNTLQNYLERTALINDLDAKELGGDCLTLMTLHAAKGLEYDYVFIAGVESGILPLGSSECEADTEEERRLFYVGITRAREWLAISYTNIRYKFGQLQHNKPSAFLYEIDNELFEYEAGSTFLSKKRSFSDAATVVFDDMPHYDRISDQYSNSYSSNNYSQMPIPTVRKMSFDQTGQHELRIGDAVRHSKFGIGRIVNIDGGGANAKVVVHFNEFGRKQLMAQYAGLEKV